MKVSGGNDAAFSRIRASARHTLLGRDERDWRPGRQDASAASAAEAHERRGGPAAARCRGCTPRAGSGSGPARRGAPLPPAAACRPPPPPLTPPPHRVAVLKLLHRCGKLLRRCLSAIDLPDRGWLSSNSCAGMAINSGDVCLEMLACEACLANIVRSRRWPFFMLLSPFQS